jgi:hypothetical protein
LVNESGLSIHHEAPAALFCAVAFILDERARLMVNRPYPRETAAMFFPEPFRAYETLR